MNLDNPRLASLLGFKLTDSQGRYMFGVQIPLRLLLWYQWARFYDWLRSV